MSGRAQKPVFEPDRFFQLLSSIFSSFYLFPSVFTYFLLILLIFDRLYLFLTVFTQIRVLTLIFTYFLISFSIIFIHFLHFLLLYLTKILIPQTCSQTGSGQVGPSQMTWPLTLCGPGQGTKNRPDPGPFRVGSGRVGSALGPAGPDPARGQCSK